MSDEVGEPTPEAEPPRADAPDRLSALLSVDLDAVGGPVRRRRRIVVNPDDRGRADAGESPTTATPSGDAPIAPPPANDWFEDPVTAVPREAVVPPAPSAPTAAVKPEPPVPMPEPETVAEPVTPVVHGDPMDWAEGGPVSGDAVAFDSTAATAAPDWFEFADDADYDAEVDFHEIADHRGATAWGTRPAWRRVLTMVVLVALLAGGAGLAYVGSRIVRESTDGTVVAPVDDPAEAGFEALVEPTPTFALFQEVDGALDSVTVLTLADDGAGGVIMVPDRTVAELPVLGEGPMELSYDLGEPAAGAQAAGVVINAGIGDFAVVDDARWADLVRPVGPLTIENPNEIAVDGSVRFAVGTLELAAEDVGPYLAARIEGETDLARLFRHQVFWEAWLAAVAANGTPEAVPGELDQGIGRFVRGIAATTPEVVTLPVELSTSTEFGDEAAFDPDVDAVAALVARLIPFPTSPVPGLRPRVRVLNGTDDTTEAATLAPRLPPLGVEVNLIGNAATASEATTTIGYNAPEFRDEAQAIADLLGVGVVAIDSRPSDAADITVTLGADYD